MVDQLHHSDLGERGFQTHTFSLHINKHTKFQVTAKCHHVTSHFAETQKQLLRTCNNNNMKNTTTLDFVKTPNLFFLERGWDRGKLYHKIICSWKKHFHSHWCSLSWTWNLDKQNNFFDHTKWKNSVIWSREKKYNLLDTNFSSDCLYSTVPLGLSCLLMQQSQLHKTGLTPPPSPNFPHLHFFLEEKVPPCIPLSLSPSLFLSLSLSLSLSFACKRRDPDQLLQLVLEFSQGCRQRKIKHKDR